MIDIFKNTEVNAALAASIFHYETHSVNRVKEMIKENGIDVRYWIYGFFRSISYATWQSTYWYSIFGKITGVISKNIFASS